LARDLRLHAIVHIRGHESTILSLHRRNEDALDKHVPFEPDIKAAGALDEALKRARSGPQRGAAARP